MELRNAARAVDRALPWSMVYRGYAMQCVYGRYALNPSGVRDPGAGVYLRPVRA